MKISGLGKVEVTKLPKRIPKTMRDPILGGKIKVDKEAYRVIWARKYGTARARKKILKVM
jgi:hypothetical protein